LATGQIGKPRAGPFSLTGQPNAMGGRDVGYMSHLLPGQGQIANPDHRRQIRGSGHTRRSVSPRRADLKMASFPRQAAVPAFSRAGICLPPNRRIINIPCS
jgi:anaerobic selenocysteine-containing dehydrogenase